MSHYLTDALEPCEQNRSEERRSDEELAALVPLAAQELQSLGKQVSASSICRIIGISCERLKRYPSTKVQVDQSILGDTRQRIQRREDVLIEQVETAIQTLQALQEPVSYRTISEQVGLSRQALQRYVRVRDVIDRSIEEDKTYHRQQELYRQEEALFKRVGASIRYGG